MSPPNRSLLVLVGALAVGGLAPRPAEGESAIKRAWEKVSQPIETAFDSACLYARFDAGAGRSKPVQKVVGWWRQAKEALNRDDDPMCALATPPALIVATTAFLESAAEHAALAVAGARDALGLDTELRLLLAEHQQLRSRLPMGHPDRERADIVLLTRSGDEALELEAFLASRDDELPPELAKKVELASIELERARYSQIRSAVGLSVLGRWIDQATQPELLAMIAAYSSIGITQDFLVNLPERGGRFVASVGQSLEARKALRNVHDRRRLRTLTEQAEDLSDKEARELVRASIERTGGDSSLVDAVEAG